MIEDALLRELVLTYALALVLIVALARLRVPPVVALIATGTLAGPAGIGIVSTEEDVQLLAEVGVILLLFTVGLDFSLGDFRRVWQRVLGGGTLQIVLTAGAVLLMLLARRPAPVSLFIGLFVALSSTAIVINELSGRNQLDSPHGRLMVGVLLFQDLCVVVLLLLVPLLSGGTSLAQVPLAIARAAVAIVAVLTASRYLLPALLGAVARSGRREAFSLAVVVASVGTAWASSLLGMSMPLGAFLGGLVLAESEFSHQAHAEIRPVRDLLAGLFFISLGMLVDLDFIAARLATVAAVTAFILIVKTAMAVAALRAVGTPTRVALIAGLGLAQVGEFSFILGRSGLEAGLLTESDWQMLLASSIVTMVVTPLVIGAAPRLARRLAAGGPGPDLARMPPLADHVVVLGFGVGGQLVARALREIGVPYLVLELNGTAVGHARRQGEPIFFADATSPDALEAAGVERARAVVSVLSDPDASMLAVQTARGLSPAVPILVRARYRKEAEVLVDLGATVAVAEEFEASLEVLTQLLGRLDVPGNAVEMLLESFRRPGGGERRRSRAVVNRRLEELSNEVGSLPVATHQLRDTDWAAGRTLGDVDLRAQTGALVIAVRRDAQNVLSPSPQRQLNPGDLLYLMGADQDIARARRRLEAGV